MMFVRYQYPLSNYNGKYLFTEEELVELLDKVYEKGVKDGKSLDTKTTVAQTNELEEYKDLFKW